MNLMNCSVKHISWGIGTVTEQKDNYIKIIFGVGEKQFVYCALKYPDDFDKALIASVNHSGDSDSTGAVTGNILGAYLGLSGIPEKYLENLELKNVIRELADDLFNDCKITEYGSYHDEVWEQKYIYKTYRPKR